MTAGPQSCKRAMSLCRLYNDSDSENITNQYSQLTKLLPEPGEFIDHLLSGFSINPYVIYFWYFSKCHQVKKVKESYRRTGKHNVYDLYSVIDIVYNSTIVAGSITVTHTLLTCLHNADIHTAILS